MNKNNKDFKNNLKRALAATQQQRKLTERKIAELEKEVDEFLSGITKPKRKEKHKVPFQKRQH